MKIKNYEIDRYVESFFPFKNPLLLYGPDEGLASYRANKIIENFLKGEKNKYQIKLFDCLEDIGNIEKSLDTTSMFSEKEVLKIYNANDKIVEIVEKNHPVNDTVLVLVIAGELTIKSKLRKFFENLDTAYAIPCYKPDKEMIKKTIQLFAHKNSLKIETTALEYLINNLGDNYQIILNELDKLLLLGENAISYKIVTDLITSNDSSEYDELLLFCLSSDRRFFNSLNRIFVRDAYEASYLLASLKRLNGIFGKAIGELESEDLTTVVSAHMPKYMFKKRDIFTNIVKNKSIEKIKNNLNIIAEIEKKIRENQQFFRIVLERGLINILQNMK